MRNTIKSLKNEIMSMEFNISEYEDNLKLLGISVNEISGSDTEEALLNYDYGQLSGLKIALAILMREEENKNENSNR